MIINCEEQVRRYFRAVDELLQTDKSLRSVYEVSQQFSGMTAYELIDASGHVHKKTYQYYFNRILATASRVSETLRVPKSSVVGLKAANSPAWGVLFWALLMSGCRPLLLDAKADAASTGVMLAHAGAAALIAEEQGGYGVPVFAPQALLSDRPRKGFTPDWEDHVLFCSSGTTGVSKVVVFDGSCLSYQIASARAMPDRTVDIMYPPTMGNLKILAMLPFHHIFGFVAVFLWYTFFGKTVVYVQDLLPETIFDTCRRLSVSHVYSVPLLWNNIAQTLMRKAALGGAKREQIFKRLIQYHTHAISKKEAGYGASRSVLKSIQQRLFGRAVKYCISGGGYIPEETLRIINGIGYPLYNGYGLTEVGITSVELDADVKGRVKGSIGRPLYLMEYSIVNAADDGAGELLIKSHTTHIGTMRDGVFEPRPQGEWLATGDIAVKDTQGNYYIKGRIKDTIINDDGENVFPDEIEAAFAALPFVERFCVLGIAPAAGARERITLVLSLAKELGADERAQLCDEIRLANGSMPFHKQVQDVFLSPEPLPVVNVTKVQRYKLRERMAASPEAFGRLDALEGNLFDGYDRKAIGRILPDMRNIFAEVLSLPLKQLSDIGHFVYDLGGDSLMYAGLILEIEKRFSVSVPVKEYARCFSINDFTLLVAQLEQAEKSPSA